jgi:hypothetical protein
VVVVAVQLLVSALYLPPVFNTSLPLAPPHTIISLPVQTAVWPARASGTLTVLVAVQVSVSGSYLPPSFDGVGEGLGACGTMFAAKAGLSPPQMIISLPIHTAVWDSRADGAFTMLVAVQLSVVGLYLPPVLSGVHGPPLQPPQTIISLPVHTAV